MQLLRDTLCKLQRIARCPAVSSRATMQDMPDDDVLLGTVIGSRYEDIDDEWRRLQSSREFVMEEHRMVAQQGRTSRQMLLLVTSPS